MNNSTRIFNCEPRYYNYNPYVCNKNCCYPKCYKNNCCNKCSGFGSIMDSLYCVEYFLCCANQACRLTSFINFFR